jgi:hypothetical protein
MPIRSLDSNESDPRYRRPMTLETRVSEALEKAWKHHTSPIVVQFSLDEPIRLAVNDVLSRDSTPNRSILLTIPAATAEIPTSNPAALQSSAGVDRRSQAKRLRRVLSDFQDSKGLSLKVSQDPGVSNQWREPQIDSAWVSRRKQHDRFWAQGFLTIVVWLQEATDADEREYRAKELLAYVAYCIVHQASANTFDYHRFPVTPGLAMTLVASFLSSAPNRPDAAEAVVTAAARSLALGMLGGIQVERGDINSPDAIDVVISSEDEVLSTGIEVTVDPITHGKLKYEVVPAMQKHGLRRATVFSAGIIDGEEDEIAKLIRDVWNRFQQRIDLVTFDHIETWISNPLAPDELPSRFIWAVGDELDAYSETPNRQAWFHVLQAYTSAL